MSGGQVMVDDGWEGRRKSKEAEAVNQLAADDKARTEDNAPTHNNKTTAAPNRRKVGPQPATCNASQPTSCHLQLQSKFGTRGYSGLLCSTGMSGRATPAGAGSGSGNAAARQVIDVLYEISTLLNTKLDRTTLSLCVSLVENGVNPEALAAVIKELRRESTRLREED
ncbi:hypothetical protein H072_9215 [Dactylellina haptotyla CBS 200.50]|uniref:Mitotic-spindle organizing protein 1 n=1 Tax=Dactylellina haptotyla (strain CBS 200.50) TaxID=1284197 RepID=S8BD69_DACHA|nr:hypothetical protein H072_9215 [Dactylellina haptotyla CBS 200.50]